MDQSLLDQLDAQIAQGRKDNLAKTTQETACLAEADQVKLRLERALKDAPQVLEDIFKIKIVKDENDHVIGYSKPTKGVFGTYDDGAYDPGLGKLLAKDATTRRASCGRD